MRGAEKSRKAEAKVEAELNLNFNLNLLSTTQMSLQRPMR